MHPAFVILLLIASNAFMTLAWYGHLKFAGPESARWGLPAVIALSWGIAFFEYCLQVPANRFGFTAYGGSFNLMELKILQEVISLSVFTVFVLLFFPEVKMKWNHLVGFVCMIAAVYFIFLERVPVG